MNLLVEMTTPYSFLNMDQRMDRMHQVQYKCHT